VVGGSSSDVILGGAGRDILVGGAGGDFILGSRGQDIVIAGTTNSDLTVVRDVWTSSLRFSDRIDQLREKISSNDDGVRDLLFGGFGRDLVQKNPFDVEIDGWFGELLS